MDFFFVLGSLHIFLGGEKREQGVKTSQIENVELIHDGEQKSQPILMWVFHHFFLSPQNVFFSLLTWQTHWNLRPFSYPRVLRF